MFFFSFVSLFGFFPLSRLSARLMTKRAYPTSPFFVSYAGTKKHAAKTAKTAKTAAGRGEGKRSAYTECRVLGRGIWICRLRIN